LQFPRAVYLGGLDNGNIDPLNVGKKDDDIHTGIHPKHYYQYRDHGILIKGKFHGGVKDFNYLHVYAVPVKIKTLKEDTDDDRRNNIGKVDHSLEKIGPLHQPAGQNIGQDKAQGYLAEHGHEDDEYIIPQGKVKIRIQECLDIAVETHQGKAGVSEYTAPVVVGKA
jgi:hypothetical protein